MKADKTRELIDKSISMAFGNENLNNKVLHDLCQLVHVELEQLELKSESHDNSIAKLMDLITYGEQQWDGQPINKGMLEGLREALRIMEGE